MSSLVRFRTFIIPTSIVFLLLVAAGWFNFSWVPSNRRDLDDRNFRVLNTLGEQLSHAINSFDKIMDNAAESGIGRDGELNKYLANVAPELNVPEKKESAPVIGEDYGDPPKIAVAADEGTHFLYLAFGNKSSRYAIRTDLDKLIDKLFPPADRNPFDVVLLSKSDGQVIFQRPSSGLVVTRIDSLDKAPENKKKGSPPTQLTAKSLSQVSSREEVMLEGVPYWLYSQPLKVSFAPADPRKSPKATVTESIAEPWVVCGLVRADHFRSQSQAISYKWILWLSAAILMAIAAYPFLRLHMSRCEERLRAFHVITIAISACFITAAVTFAFLDFCYWSHDFGPSTDEHMKKLAVAIDQNFGREKEKAFAQLSDFYKEGSKKNELRKALHNAEAQFDQHPKLAKLTTKEGVCEPRWSCRASILSDSAVADLVKSYPYLDYVGWSDFNGQQRVKWTTKRSVTPFLDLDDPSILYYPAVKSALRSKQGPDSVPAQGVGTHTSPNTGSNVTVFWKLMDGDGKEVRGRIEKTDEKRVFCASLVTNPVSVFHAILPEGFQFAVIKSDGTVVFHSETTLNLRENFFAETDQDSRFHSRVSMRDGGSLVAKYMGRPHRMYVLPMSSSQDGLWTIVVFRSLHAEETMNLEMLCLASVMFCFYALILATALVLMWWVRKGKVIGTWLRPDWRKARAYIWLVIANILAATLLLVFARMLTPSAQVFFAILIPLSTIVLNLLVLQQHRGSQGDGQATPSAHEPLAYVGACATLLAAIAVLPCPTFFRVACDFEHELFIGSTQISLAADIDARTEYVRSHYQSIEMRGDHAGELLAEPQNQHWTFPSAQNTGTLVSSYHEVLGTSIDSSKGNPPSLMETILNNATPLFNPLAAEEHNLAEAGSDTRVWSSSLSGDRANLTVPRHLFVPGVRTISSPWTPLRVLSGNWHWWLLTTVFAAAFMAGVFGLVYFTLYKLFLLDLIVPNQEPSSTAGLNPANLITTLPNNLLAIGSLPSGTITKLKASEEVRFLDSSQKPDGSIDTVAFTKALDQIPQGDRPVILRIVDRALADRDSSRRIRLALESVLPKMSKSVIVVLQADPALKAMAGESERWQTLLRDFVRLDLKSGLARRDGETDEKFDFRIEANPYQCWRFYSLTRSQRLVLVQLTQEGLVNPNCREVVSELLKEGLIVRSSGTLTVSGPDFAGFLNSIAPSIIKDFEARGDGAHTSSLRISLWVVCIGLAAFLIFTQRETVDIWVTSAAGLTAAVSTLIKAFSIFRGKSDIEA